jgi:hypothetical protein
LWCKVEVDFLYALVQSLAGGLLASEGAQQTLAALICSNVNQ